MPKTEMQWRDVISHEEFTFTFVDLLASGWPMVGAEGLDTR
jgi:hypothetical protein